MKATVVREKSFEEGEKTKFSKEWAANDFLEFFDEEGEYIDRLCDTMEEHGKEGDTFTITYTITVTI